MTPEERTAAWRRRMDSVKAFPVRFHASDESISAPSGFGGVWLHSTDATAQIMEGGWKPALVKNTIYGAAVYLSRQRWGADHAGVLECLLDLVATEVMDSFESDAGTGDEQKHVLWYLKQHGVACGQNAGPGYSNQNEAIRSHFVEAGVKAIRFYEHGTEVVAVYDPTCIRVVGERRS